MDVRLAALAIAVLIGVGIWVASKAYRAWLARSSRADDALTNLGLPHDNRPVVLGFTGDYCLPCKTQQHPALERLRAQLDTALHVLEVDALEHADLARRYGVLTVPTTVVLDGSHRVVAINYGVTPTEKLLRQVAPLLSS